MAKSNEEKQERKDVYTAFIVLGLFVVFGFLISRAGENLDVSATAWVERPESPSGYQGHPFPHDDVSIKHVRIKEKLTSLPLRSIKPVTAEVSITKPKSAIIPAGAATAIAVAPVQKIEVEAPSERIFKEKIIEVQPVVEAPVKVKPTPAPKPTPTVKKPKPVIKPAPKPKAKPAAKPKPSAITVVKSDAGINYITSDLPCVWVVGIFKNPSNVNSVVARLRLNKYDVGTGPHEKGTYVGVPCECKKDDPKQAELREIFSAQPWMLKK